MAGAGADIDDGFGLQTHHIEAFNEFGTDATREMGRRVVTARRVRKYATNVACIRVLVVHRKGHLRSPTFNYR